MQLSCAPALFIHMIVRDLFHPHATLRRQWYCYYPCFTAEDMEAQGSYTNLRVTQLGSGRARVDAHGVCLLSPPGPGTAPGPQEASNSTCCGRVGVEKIGLTKEKQLFWFEERWPHMPVVWVPHLPFSALIPARLLNQQWIAYGSAEAVTQPLCIWPWILLSGSHWPPT